MLAREGTSCGASWWWRPWRERKATGMDSRLLSKFELELGDPYGRGCWRIEIGDDGAPHGVFTVRVAAWVKSGRD